MGEDQHGSKKISSDADTEGDQSEVGSAWAQALAGREAAEE
jgi:hypothetical protein